MSKTHRRTWQLFEERVARFFGAHRNPGSGCGMTETQSDSLHPALFVECKLRARSPIHALFREVEAKAKREGKTPILALQEKHYPGWLLVCRPQDIHLLASYTKDYESLPTGETDEG